MRNIFLCVSQVNRWVTSVDNNLQILSAVLINLFQLCLLPEKTVFVLKIYQKKKTEIKMYTQKIVSEAERCQNMWSFSAWDPDRGG